MIYIKDDNQDNLVNNYDCEIEISGTPKVLAGELGMVLYTLHCTDIRIVRAAIKAFWEEVQNDSRTE